jgi:hypothetical protein
VNINSTIDPSAYKEIGTRNYWINNNLEIWNCLTVSLGLKARVFKIEFKEDQIRLRTFFQLQFIKEISLSNCIYKNIEINMLK